MKIKNEKGSVTILFALLITVIIGFVGLAVDFGYAVLKDLQLTNAIDAATLAGAQDLDGTTDTTTAKLTAEAYLQKNGIDSSTVTITFPDDNKSIRLVSNNTVNNRFMKLLGINTTGIGASAKATIGPTGAVNRGLRPFGIVIDDLDDEEGVWDIEQYAEIIMKIGDPTDDDWGSGNLGILSLGGGGSDILEDNILDGYNGTVSIGDELDTQPGNGIVSLKKEINDLFATEAEVEITETNANELESSVRMWAVPVIETFVDATGRDVVRVKGFAMLYVEDIDFTGVHTTITGRFVTRINEGDPVLDGSIEDYGAKSVKLVK